MILTKSNNDAGGAPNTPADNHLNGNGTGTAGDGVAATDEDDEPCIGKCI